MRKVTFALSLCIILCISFTSTSIAQQILPPVEYTILNDEDDIGGLVRDSFIANECFEVLNIRTRGVFGGAGNIGAFNNGLLPLGMESGLVIANCPIANLFGGNSITSAGGNIGGPQDFDLSQIVGVTTQDAGIIEFDFIPTANSVSFEYVFGSEEYCDFVGTQFNDAFGLFLSGPGINGTFSAPAGSNGSINIASFTDNLNNEVFVSINNVNNGTNSQFYVDNNIAATTNGNPDCFLSDPANNPFTTTSQLDGWTRVFTAEYPGNSGLPPLEICETYHIKIAVADGVDRIFGSAVYLRGQSFNAAQGAGVTDVVFEETDDIYAYESCGDQSATIKFTRQEIDGVSNFDELNIGVNLAGTSGETSDLNMVGPAIFGQDYETTLPIIGDVMVPFPSICHELTILDDVREQEPVEVIDLVFQNPCFCEPEVIPLLIINVPPLEFDSLVDFTSCNGSANQTVRIELEGGFPQANLDFNEFLEANQNNEFVEDIDPVPETDYTYTWTDTSGMVVSTDMTYRFDSREPGEYTFFFEASDDCGNMVFDTVTILTSGTPDLELDGQSFICPENPDAILDFDFLGSTPPFTITYTLDGTVQPPLVVNDTTDFEFIVNQSGIYEITNIAGPNCDRDVEGIATVSDQSFVLDVLPTPTLCNDSEDGMLMAMVSSGTGTFQYLWSDPGAQTTEMAIGLAPGLYTVTVTDELGCTQELQQEVLAAPQVAVVPSLISGTTCGDLSSGEITAAATGGTGVFTYEWFDNASNSVGTGATVGSLTAGTYEVVALDENDCEIRSTIMIPSDEDTPVVVAVSTIIDCNTMIVDINTDSTSTGPEFTYEWTVDPGSGGNIASGADTPSATIDEPGTFTLLVTNTTNGCTNSTPVSVMDNRVDPMADAGDNLNCIDGAVQLGGPDLETGVMITYQWTSSNGGTITGASDIANPMVSTAGTYEVLVTNMENGCTSTSVIEVTTPPEVAIEMPTNIDCRNGEVISLSGMGSTEGDDITYTWTASNGGVVASDGTTLNPVVSEGGTYTLVVTNTVTGCTNTMDIQVDDIRSDIVADPGPGAQINCNTPTVELGGGNTTTGGTISYEWQITTDAGTSMATTQTITATAGGTYTLLVTDTNNGCTAMQEIVVPEDMIDPDVAIQMPDVLTCEAPSQFLTSNGSSTGDFTYTWTTVGGNIVASSSEPTAQIDDPGMYTLTIVNNATGCESSETIQVTEDADFPEVVIATPANIDCDATQVLLDGSGSDSGPGIEYTWRDEAGNVVGTTASITVDAGGQYILEVNNMATGCAETDPVMVTDIREDPIADAGDLQVLNCDINSVILGGTTLSTGPEFEYEWTLGGEVVSNDANPEILVGGEYMVLVTNTLNNCTATEVVMINENTEDPEIDIEPSGIITCVDPIQSLLSDGSSSGPEFEYAWTGPGGFTSDLENPDITLSGDYMLVITNTINMCSVSETLTVDEDAEFPAIAIETPAIVNCRDMIIELSGEGSETGTDIVYTWVASNGGVIEDDEDTLNPEVSAAGTYTLTVSNDATGCSRTLDIVVDEDFVDPIAMVNDDLTFGCTDDFLPITGLGSSTGPNIEYEWTAIQGNITGSLDELDSEIDQPGEYELLVTNTENGCTQIASFMVTPDDALPEIAIEIPQVITCDRDMVLVNATGSADDPNLIYQWLMDGEPFVPSDNFMFTVEEPGMYTLIIEDPNNGCVSERTIPVMEDVEPPIAEAGEGVTLNCQDMMLELDAGASSAGMEFEYSWTTANGGSIVSGGDTDEPIVDAPGDYILTVRNMTTGCESTDMVSVIQENTEPVIEFVTPLTLNCRDNTIGIQANVSDQGTNFEIEWTEMGTANIDSGDDTLEPTVDEPGIYVLTITNMDNFCVTTEQVEVFQDIEDPAIAIVMPETLNCENLEVDLSGLGSSTGDNIEYSWLLISGLGSFQTSPSEINTSVDGPGVFSLTVTNTENFCESTMQIVVDQDIEMPMAVTGETQEVTCTNTEAMLSGVGSSVGNEFTYQWVANNGGSIVSGGTTLTPTVSSPGEYQLTVRNNENGCESISVQSVTSNEVFPQEALPIPLVLNCDIMDQIITTEANPGITYTWSTTNGNIVGPMEGTSIIVDMPGTYTRIITDNLTGCSTSNDFEVLQDIVDPDVNAGPGGMLTCTETVVALDGTGSEGNNFTYEWTTVDGAFSGPVNELEAFANTPGTYTLTVFNNDNMCSASSDVVVTVDPDIPTGIEASVMPPFCFGDPGTISFDNILGGGQPPFEYSIDGGQTFGGSDIFPGLMAGLTYDLIIRDDNGCTAVEQVTIPTVDSLSVIVPEDFVEIDLGESFDIRAITTLDTSEIVSVTWTPSDGLSCDDCLNPEATPGFGTIYSVVVVSENGCVDEATIQFRVNRNINIYIPSAFSPHNDDGINDLFMPFGKQSLDADVLEFQIYDRWGEQVFTDGDFKLNDPQRGWNGDFREEESPVGVYVYYIVLEFVDGSTELFEGDVTLMN